MKPEWQNENENGEIWRSILRMEQNENEPFWEWKDRFHSGMGHADRRAQERQNFGRPTHELGGRTQKR